MIDPADLSFRIRDLTDALRVRGEQNVLDRIAVIGNEELRRRLVDELCKHFTMPTIYDHAAEIQGLLVAARKGDFSARDAISRKTADLSYFECVALDRMVPEAFAGWVQGYEFTVV